MPEKIENTDCRIGENEDPAYKYAEVPNIETLHSCILQWQGRYNEWLRSRSSEAWDKLDEISGPAEQALAPLPSGTVVSLADFRLTRRGSALPPAPETRWYALAAAGGHQDELPETISFADGQLEASFRLEGSEVVIELYVCDPVFGLPIYAGRNWQLVLGDLANESATHTTTVAFDSDGFAEARLQDTVHLRRCMNAVALFDLQEPPYANLDEDS